MPEVGSRLDVRLMEVFEDDDERFGILGRLATLLPVGAFGRILERGRFVGVVTTGALLAGEVAEATEELRRSALGVREPRRSSSEVRAAERLSPVGVTADELRRSVLSGFAPEDMLPVFPGGFPPAMSLALGVPGDSLTLTVDPAVGMVSGFSLIDGLVTSLGSGLLWLTLPPVDDLELAVFTGF